MRVKNQYPDWVEKFRGPGKTIRKVKNGYGLYKCTSVYVPGEKYPKSKQEYLGMITEKDGFIPKKTVSNNPSYIEYGVSRLIWLNFKRELVRSSYMGDELLVRISIVKYLFGTVNHDLMLLSFISDGCIDEMDKRLSSTSEKRIENLASKIDTLLRKKIRDPNDRSLLESLLRNCVLDSKNRTAQLPAVPDVAIEIMERYGLRYGNG